MADPVTHWKNLKLDGILGMYTYNIIGKSRSFVVDTYKSQMDCIRKSAMLVVSPGFTDQQIWTHLAYRHPIQIEGPQYGSISTDDMKTQLGYDNKTVFHSRKGLKETLGGQMAELRYGILAWTPVEKRSQGIWFLHTWGVNMESTNTTDARYVIVGGQFTRPNYIRLLSRMFGIVERAVDKLHELYPNRMVVLRMAKLGFGAWVAEVPKGDVQPLLNIYRGFLADICNRMGRSTWLQVRHPDFAPNKAITSTWKNQEWVQVENHANPYGELPNSDDGQSYPINAVSLVVNAWDDGSFIGNGGSHDNSMDGWTVAGYGPGSHVVNASFLHNVFFCPELLAPNTWIRVPCEAKQSCKSEKVEVTSKSESSSTTHNSSVALLYDLSEEQVHVMLEDGQWYHAKVWQTLALWQYIQQGSSHTSVGDHVVHFSRDDCNRVQYENDAKQIRRMRGEVLLVSGDIKGMYYRPLPWQWATYQTIKSLSTQGVLEETPHTIGKRVVTIGGTNGVYYYIADWGLKRTYFWVNIDDVVLAKQGMLAIVTKKRSRPLSDVHTRPPKHVKT